MFSKCCSVGLFVKCLTNRFHVKLTSRTISHSCLLSAWWTRAHYWSQHWMFASGWLRSYVLWFRGLRETAKCCGTFAQSCVKKQRRKPRQTETAKRRQNRNVLRCLIKKKLYWVMTGHWQLFWETTDLRAVCWCTVDAADVSIEACLLCTATAQLDRPTCQY
jgi:hypothetical protein